jgi:uncharacterized protein
LEFSSFQIIYIGCVVFLTAFIKTCFGVGPGIFMTSMLSLLLPPKLALGLGGVVMLLTDFTSIFHHWKNASRSILVTILSGCLGGLIAGGYIIQFTPDRLFARIVGAFCAAFALQQLMRSASLPFLNRWGEWAKNYRPQRWHGVLIGFAGGISSAIAHAGGIVFSIYVLTLQPTKSVFVATLLHIFIISDSFKNLVYWKIDLLTWPVVAFALCMLPLMILGSLAGYLLHRRISLPLFLKCILLLVIAASVRLILFA